MQYKVLAATATARVTIAQYSATSDYVVAATALPSKERVAKRFPVSERAAAWKAARHLADVATTPVFDAALVAPAIHAYNDAYVAFIHAAGVKNRSVQSLSALLVAAHASARAAVAA